jgi:gliding motility-associated-like protein
MKLKIIILLCFFINISKAQTCADTAIKVTYHADNYKLGFREKLIDFNNRNLLFGAYEKKISNNITIFGNFLIKLNQNETINFAKKINTTINFPGEYLGMIKCLKNGNYLISLGNSLGNNNSQPDSISRLLLLNNNGNIIWSKQYSTQAGRIGIRLIEETNNGDLIMYLSSQVDLIFHDEQFDALMRINSLGNILWCKYYPSTFFSLQTFGESMSIVGNNIYLRGRLIESNFNPQPFFEHRLSISKINALNGYVIDSKTYLDLKVEDDGSQTFYGKNLTNQISANDNNILITDRFRNFSGTKSGCTKAILDTSLNITNAVYFTTPNSYYKDFRIISDKNKNIFIYSHININNNLQSFITKIDSNNIPKRELYFDFPISIVYQTIPVNPIGLKDKYINLVTPYFQNGDIYLQLFQFPDNIPISPCYGKDTNLIQIQPYTITEVHHPFLNQGIDITDIAVTNFPVTITDLPLVMQKECEVISDCNLLKINPTNDSICNLTNEVQFSAHINGGCLKKVYWQLETSAYTYIRAINDTTVAIKFKQTWQGKLYASINPCVALKDSVVLNVFKNPGTINLGKDTTLCAGATLILQAGFGFKDYTWQNGNTSSTQIVAIAGTYSVLAHDGCSNSFKDTIVVKFYTQPSKLQLGNDSTLCQNESLVLKAGKNYKTYLWHNSTVADSVKITEAGTYFVKATDSCGNIFKDTIIVNYFINRPAVNLGNDIVFCPQKNYTLQAGVGYKKYTWQNGSVANNFSATQAGLYFVKVIDSCGNISADTVVIKPAENITLKADFTNAICLYDTARIVLQNNVSQYNVTPNSTINLQNNILKLFPSQNTIYNIKASTAAGCTVSDTVLIKVKLCDDEVYFPTAFTPNGDNINDYFLPYSESKPISYELNIFNRYGQNIFTSKNIKTGWNGKWQTEMQNTGSYVWVCKYQFRNKLMQTKKGSFLLVK